jgi:mannose-1-phosphate guanylyltransferase
MKAFLLAAGVGSRLRPITDHTPKCMLPIAGTPLIDIWLDAFYSAGVDDVLVNLHHLPNVVQQHLQSRPGPPTIRTRFERELLGSAGTLRANRDWVGDDDFFLAVNADNLTDFDLRSLVDFHRAGGTEATVTVIHAEHPENFGVVDVDASSLVIGFSEKPTAPSSDLVNAGMYAFNPSVLADIREGTPRDIGYDLLPGLIGRARAMPVTGYFCDIGTPASYEEASRSWPSRVAS